MKLVDLAQESIRLLEECGTQGIRSDVLAEKLQSPKRRVYDIVAILKALGFVSTKRRSDGTTLAWVDPKAGLVERVQYEELKANLSDAIMTKNKLQDQVAELNERLRVARSKIRNETMTVEAVRKAEFDTTQLRVRPLSNMGFKRVTDSGMEVVIETHDPGMTVDPSVMGVDEAEAVIRNLERV